MNKYQQTSALDPNDLPSYDAAHVWHPYTSMTEHAPTYPLVTSAKGVYLELADGRYLVDGMSSWWSAIHGYNHPRLNAAITEQLKNMAHVMFGGLTHEPAVQLAKKLIDLIAQPLQAVFFSDSGSVAVEVAIKMAIQYWFAQGQTSKQRLLTVRNGYHGDTFGAMAVCDPINGMHNIFSRILPQHFFADAPNCQDHKPESANTASLEQLLINHHQEIAAIILEPIVQGAGGMRIYGSQYLSKVRSLCEQYQVLLILDEIATGFGRTGSLFAYQQANIVPDILCLGKALTGGYLSLAATLTSKKIAHGISAQGHGVLMHGPTFMANPLACSVANASIDLLLESPWQQRVTAIEAQLKRELAACKELANVHEVRVKGAIGIVELKQPIVGNSLQTFFLESGVWIRPFRNLVYLMPAYIIQPSELSLLCTAVLNGLAKQAQL